MKNLIGKKVLVTCSQWFLAPDGNEYRAAFGTLTCIINDNEMNIRMARTHANFYLKVGGFMIAGCEAKFVIQSDIEPPKGMVKGWTTHEGKFVEYERPSLIYFAD